jgi:maltose alpha-D-glucosyltransferase/alpha-amylase
VADYYGVDPRYGTLCDFVEFTHAAEQRGIRVLIDLVVNHASNEHAWFKQVRKDRIRNTGIGISGQRRNRRMPILAWFSRVQKSTRSFDKQSKAWYFHRFYDFQPDLNTSNPEVQAERSSRSWNFGFSSVCPVSAWMQFSSSRVRPRRPRARAGF